MTCAITQVELHGTVVVFSETRSQPSMHWKQSIPATNLPWLHNKCTTEYKIKLL